MPICVFIEPQEGAAWPELLTFAQASDRLGFDGFFRSDHYLPPDGVMRGTPASTTRCRMPRGSSGRMASTSR